MKPRDTTLTRKEFLRAFAGLVTYAAPAVVVLDQLGCSGGTGGTVGTGSPNNPYCRYDYDDAGVVDSVSCSYPDGGSCSASTASVCP